MASKTTKSLKSQVQKLNALFALIRQVCEKHLFCHNWPEDSDKEKQPCSGAEWPIRLVWPSLWERGNSPHLFRKTQKRPKKPCSGAEWPNRLVWPSLWERGNSHYLVGKTPKDPKSRVQVQNGPFDWFGPVCGKEVIHRIWSGKLRKAQKAVFRCRMVHST